MIVLGLSSMKDAVKMHSITAVNCRLAAAIGLSGCVDDDDGQEDMRKGASTAHHPYSYEMSTHDCINGAERPICILYVQHACDRLPFFQFIEKQTKKNVRFLCLVLRREWEESERSISSKYVPANLCYNTHITHRKTLPSFFPLLKYINGSFVCCARKNIRARPSMTRWR